MKRLLVLPLLCGIALATLISCGHKDDNVVARIGYLRKIRQSEIEEYLKQNPTAGNESEAFRLFLKSEILFRAAHKTKFDRKGDLRRQFEEARKAWIAENFLKNVVQQNYGITESDLKRYYSQNRKRLFRKAPKPKADSIPGFLTMSAQQQKSSLNPYISFESVRAAIIDSILLRKSDLQSAYEKQKDRFYSRPHVKIAHLFAAAQTSAVEAASALGKGTSFEKAVELFSEDSASRAGSGVLGVVWPGDSVPGWGVIDSLNRILFTGDSLLVKEGFTTPVITSPRGFHIFRVLEANPRSLREFRDVEAALAAEVLGEWKNNTEEMYYNELGKKYDISILDTIQPPTEQEIQTYYNEIYRKDLGDSAKPLAEVKDRLAAILRDDRVERFPDDFVFARATKRLKITQAKLDRYRAGIPESFRRRYQTWKGRNHIIRTLFFNELLNREASRTRFIHLPETKKAIQLWEKSFWSERFDKDYLQRDLGFEEKDLRRYYAQHRRSFAASGKLQSFSDARADVATALLGGPKELKRFYELNAEDFASDSGQIRPFDQVAADVEKAYLAQEKEKRIERIMRNLRRMLGVKILKKEYADELPENETKLFDMAQQITAQGDEGLKKAETILLKMRKDYSESRLAKQVCFSLGQIYISQGDYQKALKEFKKILRLYKDTDYGCKAQFMVAYVYSEYIRDLMLAKTAYEKTINEYPKCELVDDAQFMIKYLGKDPSEIDFLKAVDSTDVSAEADTAGRP